jgi:uncharacterized membrane protein
MELDNLFEQRNYSRNQKRNNFSRFDQDDDEYRNNYQERKTGGSHYATYVFNRIWSNKKLRILFILLSITVIAIVIALLVVFAPLLLKAFNYLTQNGISGVVESVKALLDKLWLGAGK